jgi:hypothetical protein
MAGRIIEPVAQLRGRVDRAACLGPRELRCAGGAYAFINRE